MNFISHLFISKTLYDHLPKGMEIDKKAFMYGSIRPDLPSKLFQKPHTLDNYLNIVCKISNELMNNKYSLKQYSYKLGEICHFICDFFCYYHSDEAIYNKSLSHFIYEFRLHFILRRTYIKEEMKKILDVETEREDITSIISEMQKKYFLNSKSFKKDIYYSYLTALWICKSLFYFSVQFSYSNLVNEVGLYALKSVKGGQL